MLPKKVLVLPKAAGPRLADAINNHAEAIEDTIQQVRVLTKLTEPMARPFWGRLKWLLFGR